MFLGNEAFSDIIKNTPLISIDLIIKNSLGEVLLGKRVNKPAKNTWFVPGGRIYKDESLAKAFKRITLSELGVMIDINHSKFNGIYEHFYDENVFNDEFSTHYIVLAFDMHITNTPMTNNQHENYKWFEVNSLLKDEDVHHFVKDYFIEVKGIKND